MRSSAVAILSASSWNALVARIALEHIDSALVVLFDPGHRPGRILFLEPDVGIAGHVLRQCDSRQGNGKRQDEAKDGHWRETFEIGSVTFLPTVLLRATVLRAYLKRPQTNLLDNA